jgi:hypothetical protein
MEIMTHDEFWARNPAPGTQFIELDGVNRVIANEIDPDVDDPDDITMVSVSGIHPFNDSIAVVSWGSWDDQAELIETHNKGVASMVKEDPSYVHDCRIGIDKA